MEIYQDLDNAIRAGDPRLARIDVSQPIFIAQDNLPPVVLPLQRILPKAAIAPEEEIASSRLSLEEEIEKFHFKEEENSGVAIVTISDAEGETNRHSGVHALILVIARPDSSSEEEEDQIALNKGNKSLRASWLLKIKCQLQRKPPSPKFHPHFLLPLLYFLPTLD